MADPIRLPNRTPKDLSTAKVTRTAQQKFKRRQKREKWNQDMRHPSNKEQGRSPMNRNDSGMAVQNSNKKKVTKRALRDRSAGKPDRDQGNVIDIRV
ncbi:MAG: hypothetical protein DRH90_13910 [Deltaproteobacteria bacterium]|nr:MAG: hypothetical protein DRH90_13910 [Deltaproteobacteria bacterium]RLC16096.1 MAG: hypothetical protein DRI24_09295 [Deltaproteobacteria bacterium]